MGLADDCGKATDRVAYQQVLADGVGEMKEKIITVIGSLNFDLIFKQRRLAAIGETYTAEHLSLAGGGKGANQAVQCAKLGVPTYLVGSVGNDDMGSQLLSELAQYGVNTDYVKRTAELTGVGVVNALEDGSLLATISRGANATLTKQRIDEIDALLKRSSIIILQLEVPIETVEYCIYRAREWGCYIILNAAPAALIAAGALAGVDCLVVNEPEASFYCNRRIDDLASAMKYGHDLYKQIGELLIITLGSKGSVLFSGGEPIAIEAKKVHSIETTGAGDSFIGALASQLLRGTDVVAAAEFATRAAAVTVTRIGAQSAMPTWEELEK